MRGGRDMLTPTSTPAIVGTGDTSINAKRRVPKSAFFISLPHYSRYGMFNLIGTFFFY
jgi:hypothetical protein